MKTFYTLLAVAIVGFVAAGCGDSSTPSGQTLTPTPTTNYLTTLVTADKTADKTIDVSYLNSALQLYLTQEGHYPKTLEELKPNYVSRLPVLLPGMALDYDSTNGLVKVVSQ